MPDTIITPESLATTFATIVAGSAQTYVPTFARLVGQGHEPARISTVLRWVSEGPNPFWRERLRQANSPAAYLIKSYPTIDSQAVELPVPADEPVEPTRDAQIDICSLWEAILDYCDAPRDVDAALWVAERIGIPLELRETLCNGVRETHEWACATGFTEPGGVRWRAIAMLGAWSWVLGRYEGVVTISVPLDVQPEV